MPGSIVTVWPASEKRQNPPAVPLLMIAGVAIVVGVWIVIRNTKERFTSW
jgi:predicted nucleic acid-binding protein